MRADDIVLAILVLSGIAQGRIVGSELEWDPKGYILYCPCSGRFSNQVELLLGSLYFAKSLDRVLVIPPFIDYQHAVGQRKDNRRYLCFMFSYGYFDLNALREYDEDIVTFEDFMYELAPTHWPLAERVAYCSSRAAEGNNDMCPRKGNPFSTFWEAQNVEFSRSEIWSGDLHYNVEYDPWRVMWMETFNPSEHPVLAFMNAPTSTPLSLDRDHLHKYLKWSADIEREGERYITDNIERPYVGLHLRNGADWVSHQ
nr:GDP-fucose protein O-fucosyltransferase 1-like [Lytechinus pictus]